VKELARRFFEQIGLPIDEVLSRSDLDEREKKYPHAYSTDIDRRGDVRVMANLKNDEYSMDTMLHEMGHAVYSQNIDPALPFLLRTEAHTLTTEAVAMFFGRLARNARWLHDLGVLTSKERAEIEPISRKSQRLAALVLARWCQVMFRFERELYKNPDQDLNTLWWDLVETYQYVHRPEGREAAADWAAKIHLASYPVYYHNYMLGEMLASQLHAYLTRRVLPVSRGREVAPVNHPEVGRYLKEKLFRPGARYRWDELIRRATGEPLEARYFVEQFVKL